MNLVMGTTIITFSVAVKCEVLWTNEPPSDILLWDLTFALIHRQFTSRNKDTNKDLD